MKDRRDLYQAPPPSQTQPQSQPTYACPIMGKATIGRARCQALCSRPRENKEKCSTIQCRSPFRLCYNCVLKNPDNPRLVADPEVGLCSQCERENAEAPVQKTEAKANVIPIREATDTKAPKPAESILHARSQGSLPLVSQTTNPISLIGQVVLVPCSFVETLPDQPRIEFDEADMVALTMSIKDNGQLVPGEVVPVNGGYQLTDGERRLRACRRIGIPFKAVIAEPCEYDEQKKRSILMNFNRKSHSPIETALAMRFLEGKVRTESKEELSPHQIRLRVANMLGCSVGNVTNYLKVLDELAPGVVELLRPQDGRRPLRLCLALELTAFHENPEEQLQMAKVMVEKDMMLQEGRNFMAMQAREKNISRGRGRERSPANQREVLETAALRMQAVLTEVLDLSAFQIRQMFDRSHRSKFDNLLENLSRLNNDFGQILEIMNDMKDDFQFSEEAN